MKQEDFFIGNTNSKIFFLKMFFKFNQPELGQPMKTMKSLCGKK